MYNRRSAGFSLIELIMVLVLAGILAATAVVYWPGDGINVSAQAEQLAGDIRYLQSLAMTHGQRTRINFGADRYWFSNLDGSTRLTHPAIGTSEVLLDRGTALTSPYPYLIFSSDGVPYIDTALPGNPLTADAVITLSAGGASRSIRISPDTGKVTVS